MDGGILLIKAEDTVETTSSFGGRDDKKFNFRQGEESAGYESGSPADIWKHVPLAERKGHKPFWENIMTKNF